MQVALISSYPDIGKIIDNEGNLRCYYCLQILKSVHYDHVYPRKHGGIDTAFNLVASCKHCNSKKNARDPMDFWESDVHYSMKEKLHPYFWLLLRFDFERRVNAAIIQILQKKLEKPLLGVTV